MTPDQASIIIDKIDGIVARFAKLDSRLDVHDQKHVALDSEHKEITITLKEHGKRISDVERDSQQNKRDIERLTSLVEKMIWAFAAPLITATVAGIIWAISQAVVK